MTQTIIFTSANGAYLPKVRTLAKSVKRHVPNSVFVIFLAELDATLWLSKEDNQLFDRIITPTEVGYPDNLGWAVTHNIVEYCTAVKPQIALQLQEEYKSNVIFFDPDTVLFSDINEILNILNESPIIFTPHILDAEQNENFIAIQENEISVLKHGLYNLGFFAVAPNQIGRTFLQWYAARLYKFCIDDPASGLFTDQKWCDLVPVIFPQTHIYRNRGANVASWNLSNRKLKIGDDGYIYVENKKLIFYHFTGYDSGAGAAMTTKYSGANPIVEGLWAWYTYQLVINRNTKLQIDWSMGRLACGYKLSNHVHKAIREVYCEDFFPGSPYALSFSELQGML